MSYHMAAASPGPRDTPQPANPSLGPRVSTGNKGWTDPHLQHRESIDRVPTLARQPSGHHQPGARRQVTSAGTRDTSREEHPAPSTAPGTGPSGSGPT